MYINSFVIPVPKKNLNQYKKMAKASAKLWKKHGAIEYFEGLGDGLSKGKNTSFPRSVKLKSGEVVAFGYAVFKSAAHCEQVMKRIHKDKEIMKLWDNMPFDGMRMIFGGFKAIAKT